MRPRRLPPGWEMPGRYGAVSFPQARPLSCFQEGACVDLPMKLINIALDVGLHHDVERGLVQRDDRHVSDGELHELPEQRRVVTLLALPPSGIEQPVHLGILVVRDIPDRVLTVPDPAEEEIRIIEPCTEYIYRHRPVLLRSACCEIRQLLDCDFHADFGERVLDDEGGRL